MTLALREQKPHFPKITSDDVFLQLRKEVNEIVEQLEPQRRRTILMKAVLFPLLYVVLWVSAMVFGAESPAIFYSCYIGMGFMLVVIFLNIIHDAVHGTIFRSRKWNDRYVRLFDLMGANSYIWRLRHVRFHHNYPNVCGWDTDIEQSELFRVFPHGGYSRFHRYQHLYLPLIYPLFLFNWLLVRDFRDFFERRKTVHKLVNIPKGEYVKLILCKTFFFSYLLFVPVFFFGFSWGQAFSAFFLMILGASIFALLVLLPPHANTESAFPLPDAHNSMPSSWFMHMMQTTNDVQADNWFTRNFMGCFHYHVAHHLFPHVNHVYYPEVTQKLVELAVRQNLPYRAMPLLTALKKHFLLIKQNGSPAGFSIWEETM